MSLLSIVSVSPLTVSATFPLSSKSNSIFSTSSILGARESTGFDSGFLCSFSLGSGETIGGLSDITLQSSSNT